MQQEEWHSAAWCKIMELGLLRGNTSSNVNISCLPISSEHASPSRSHGAQGFCSITFNFLEVFVWAVLTWNEYFSTRAGCGFSPEHGRDRAARSNCSLLSSLPDSQWPSWVSSSRFLINMLRAVFTLRLYSAGCLRTVGDLLCKHCKG